MFDQLDLFTTTSCDYEEEQKELKHQREVAARMEQLRQERENLLTSKLTSRQHRLVDYLETNLVPGKFFSIEEICNAGLGYVFNKNPRIHDKCAALGADIRAINWAIADRYSIIIKDDKGGCKIAESEKEFNAWVQGEKDKLENKYAYLNNLKWKAKRDGTVPAVNLAGRALKPDETKVIEVFKEGH